jgi:H+-translocating NAD(P) transhydrogenase subunit alpha
MIAIGVPAEGEDEPRIGLTPETVKKLVKAGASVTVRSGAGERSHFSNQDYSAAGAKIAKTDADAVGDADIVLTVRRPQPAVVKAMKKGAALIGMLDPFSDADGLDALAKSGVALFAMELMPRISRAQSMDVLSSQSNLAGYKAVVDAAAAFERALPMMMTAAGTVPAARVFVMGVGVAGLQAIATRAASAPSSQRPTCARPSRSRWPRSAPNSSRSRTRSSSRPRPRPATPRRCPTPTRRSKLNLSPST